MLGQTAIFCQRILFFIPRTLTSKNSYHRYNALHSVRTSIDMITCTSPEAWTSNSPGHPASYSSKFLSNSVIKDCVPRELWTTGVVCFWTNERTKSFRRVSSVCTSEMFARDLLWSWPDFNLCTHGVYLQLPLDRAPRFRLKCRNLTAQCERSDVSGFWRILRNVT